MATMQELRELAGGIASQSGAIATDVLTDAEVRLAAAGILVMAEALSICVKASVPESI
jgi:hypothetical protein